ncbi:MAG: site-specific integrase [Pedosphaera sp.]|nr:site-specific integrase [Pedosphaera sp.]
MACVWKHPKSDFWFARFRDERGVWVNRSTKTTDRTKAAETARTLEHAAKLARQGNLTQDRARALVSELLERTSDATESIRSETVETFFARHVESLEETVSPGTHARYRGVMERFQTHLGQRSKRELNGILPKDVQGYVTTRAREVEGTTVAADIKDLRAVFNSAVGLGLMDKSPVRGIRLPKCKAMTREIFTAAKLRLLVDASEGDWRTAILCGCYLGARLGDVVKLRWQDKDMAAGETGTITFRQSKTGRMTTIPLAADLREHLDAIAGDKAEMYLMPTLANRRPGGRNGLSGTFVKLMEKAGIDPHYVEAKGKRFAKLSFHALRHGFNSALANAGVSQEVRMKLTGHQTTAMNSRYTHYELDTLRAAVCKPPSLDSTK